MPRFRKLSPAEIPENVPILSARAQVTQEYDALLADFVIGEYGRAELLDGERRDMVRSRLHAAARRRGLALRFRPGPGPLIFCVEAAPVPVANPTLAQEPRVSAQRDLLPPRPPRPRPKAVGRYDAVLPRWMREGGQIDRGGSSKRRQGR